MILTDANRQLMSRPDDEHFPSVHEMQELCRHAKERGEIVRSDPQRMFFVAREGLRLVLSDDRELSPTHWALSQMAAASRVPMYVLEKLKTETAARVLNESFPRHELSERLALVEGDQLRALTSTSYSRLWDTEVLQEVERWLLPGDRFVPAMPTMNTDERGTNVRGNCKPALFRSDRDSFAFFYSDKRPGDDGLGGMRKGIFVQNSEVGAKSFAFGSFYFRDMCANFLIWDATQVRRRKAVHKGSLENVWREFKLELIEASAEVEQHALDRFHRAAETPFVGDGSATEQNLEDAAERLVRQLRTPQKRAQAIVEESQLPENTPGKLTLWSIVNGLTSVAKQARWAEERTQASSMAGELLGAGR